MTFLAGEVVSVLGFKVNSAGAKAYDRQMALTASNAEKFERRHNAAMTRASAAAGHLGGAVKTVGAAAATAGAVGVATLAVEVFKATKEAAGFEAAMRNVNSIAKLSEGALKGVSEEVLAMAGKTGQAPKVLAEGLYDIVSSGFKAKDGLKILEASATAATAGLTDTATSTKAVVAVLNSYKLGAEDAGKVSDQLFQIVNQGVISFPELASQIGEVLPFAASLGIGLDQLGGSIATITKGGTNASQTMTQVKGIFSQMLSPSTSLKKAIKETGEGSAEALLKHKGLQGSLEALVGTTDGSKAAIQRMFPDVQALGGVLALTGKKAAGARDDLASMAEAGGSTREAFAEQSKSYEVSAQKFGAAWKAAQITVGEQVLPVLTKKLGEWSMGLSDAIESGDLQKLGDDVARGASTALEALEALARATPGIARGMARGLDLFLGVITTIDDAILVMGKAFNALPGPDIDLSDLERGIDRINAFRESLRPKPPTIKVHVQGDIDDAIGALRKIQGTKVEGKVMKILGQDSSARSKLKALEAIGIDPKTAIMLANIGDALKGIATVNGALARMQTYKRIQVEINTMLSGASLGDLLKGPSALSPKPKGKASGRGPGQSERALVGEGGGPEWVVDPARGSALRVDAPTLLDLPPTAFVIPTEAQHRDRGRSLFDEVIAQSPSLGLLASIAKDLGVPGYKAGRPHYRPSKKKAAKAVKNLPVPDKVTYAAVPEEDLKADVDKARTNWKKRDKSIKDYENKVRKDRDAVTKADKSKDKKAKAAARTKLSKDSAHLNALKSGGQGLRPAQEVYNAWREESSLLKKLQAKNREIERLNTIQETDRQKMANAAGAHDENAYGAAQKDRQSVLGKLKETYDKAIGLAKDGSKLKAELESSLATVVGDIQDSEESYGDTQQAPDEPDAPDLTTAQKTLLAADDKAIALAGLTKGLDDDKAGASKLVDDLQGILNSLTSGAQPASDDLITDIAGQLKSAKDNFESITTGKGNDPDLQAQIDQANEETRIAREEARLNRQALEVFGGSGDIGAGGRNAMAAATAPTVNVYTLHPGDTRTLDAIGRAATAGVDLQGMRQSVRERVG